MIRKITLMKFVEGCSKLKNWFEKINKTEERRQLKKKLAEEKQSRTTQIVLPLKILPFKLNPQLIYESYTPFVISTLQNSSERVRSYNSNVCKHLHSNKLSLDDIVQFTMRPLGCLINGMLNEIKGQPESIIFNDYNGAFSFSNQIARLSDSLFDDMTDFVTLAVKDYYYDRSSYYRKIISYLKEALNGKTSILQSEFIKSLYDTTGEHSDYFDQIVRFVISLAAEAGTLSKEKQGNTYQLMFISDMSQTKLKKYSTYDFEKYEFLKTLAMKKGEL